MLDLSQRRVLLGVTGGIAAYKSAMLVRLLRGAGAEVRVVMTRAAEAFIAPLTLQALSGQRVRSELLDPEAESAMGHIELARWADLVLVAPASADFLSRIAHGMADDLLTTLCLASAAPLAVAPSMNRQMWQHPATCDNLALLVGRGVHCWGPVSGDQACGEKGPGRMLEPEQLLERVAALWAVGPLQGVRALVTAGPTREPIDPVRFVGNRSSGKMGYALAAALRELGAEVTLVSGPVVLPAPAGVARVSVETALEMRAEVMARVEACDLFAAVAAVSDYRPQEVHFEKLKKQRERLHLSLVRNPDILAEVAASTRPPFTLGFAAETQDLAANAATKLREKGLDMIAANRVGSGEGGFESERNAISLFWEGGGRDLEMAPKIRLARELAKVVAERYRLARAGSQRTADPF
jgi:phosphopantothenoylcysteine decarboxylase/phosphopantothenate--cysteine ligase